MRRSAKNARLLPPKSVTASVQGKIHSGLSVSALEKPPTFSAFWQRYLYLTTFTTTSWHLGHSKVRLSWSGLSGSIATSHVNSPQLPQRGVASNRGCGTNSIFLIMVILTCSDWACRTVSIDNPRYPQEPPAKKFPASDETFRAHQTLMPQNARPVPSPIAPPARRLRGRSPAAPFAFAV